MNVSVVFGILFIAHGCFTNFLEALMHLLLPVDHFAPSGAVDTFACVPKLSGTWSGGPKDCCRT